MSNNTPGTILMFILFRWIPILAIVKAIAWVVREVKIKEIGDVYY